MRGGYNLLAHYTLKGYLARLLNSATDCTFNIISCTFWRALPLEKNVVVPQEVCPQGSTVAFRQNEDCKGRPL
jgi:hypothetical protein